MLSVFLCVDPIFPNTVRSEAFSEPHARIVTRFCLFVSGWDRQTDLLRGVDEMGVGVSINTVSMEAQGLSDPPVNLQGGCRGQRGGQRSAFMLITNNAVLCPQHREKTVNTGCSYEPQCNYTTCFHDISFLSFVYSWISHSVFCFFLKKKLTQKLG